MSRTISAGWLTDFNGGYFSPKTLFSQVYSDSAGTNLSKYLTDLENSLNKSVSDLENSIRNTSLVVDLNETGSKAFSSGVIGVSNSLGVKHGGTGRSSLTEKGLLIGSGTSQVSLLLPSSSDKPEILLSYNSNSPKYGEVGLVSVTGNESIQIQINLDSTLTTSCSIGAASDKTAGVVSTVDQSFCGKKTFLDGIDLNNKILENVRGYLISNDDKIYFVDNNELTLAYFDGVGVHATDFYSGKRNGSPFLNYNSVIEDIYTILGETSTQDTGFGGISHRAQINSLTTTLSGEVSERISEDTLIRSELSEEASSRIDADTGLALSIFSLQKVGLSVSLESSDSHTLQDLVNAAAPIGVSGCLPVASGGTGKTQFEPNAILMGGENKEITTLSAPETKNLFLVSGDTGTAPLYREITASFEQKILGLGAPWLNLGFKTGETSYDKIVSVELPLAAKNSSGIIVAHVEQEISGCKTFINGLNIQENFYIVDNNENSLFSVDFTNNVINSNTLIPMNEKQSLGSPDNPWQVLRVSNGISVGNEAGKIGQILKLSDGMKIMYKTSAFTLAPYSATIQGDNISLDGSVILSANNWGTALPSSGSEGQIFFLLST